MVRRRPGTLLPLEIGILEQAVDARDPIHGFAIAKLLRDASGARVLTAHGTLYKALARLETAGLLASSWEDPDIAATAGRPRRRLYEVTGAGRAALVAARAQLPSPRLQPGVEPAPSSRNPPLPKLRRTATEMVAVRRNFGETRAFGLGEFV
ncbi:MAG: PadR family transcriptional regulator [Actinomycetota bacterium]|nr:PadR family transcriptional regulator [Actinomycetota bacterium]